MSRFDRIRDILKTDIATVTFTKVDGTTRVMHCTLVPTFLPEAPQKTVEAVEKPEAVPTALRVWDLDKTAWRSFKLDSVVELSYNNIVVHFE